jgi:hypothetical protein
MSKNKNYLAIFAILFIVYNFLVFFIGGFTGHSSAFWASYVFEIISFATICTILCTLMKGDKGTKIFFLGYSIMMWSTVYGIIQFIVSTVFIFMDDYVKPAVVIQLLLLVAYITVVLLCSNTKKVIEDVQETRSAQISNMKTMISEMEIISALNMDANLKSAVKKLADEFKFSDVVSSDETLPIEQQLFGEISMLKMNCKTNPENALLLIEQISEHLAERNIICKNSKKRF